MWVRNLFFLGLILAGSALLAASLFPSQAPPRVRGFDAQQMEADEFQSVVKQVNAALREQWSLRQLEPGERAPDLALVRRLSLAMTGAIPSLEELRQFENYDGEQRLQWWLAGLLQDPRFPDYWAERLARVYVGTEGGPFLVYRRHRLVSWLTDELAKNRPYDQIVRDLIASDGLWTDTPATNFITVTIEQANKNQPNPERLAGRVSRAFLGVRIDCAQCHNHPYAEWKQNDFQGLAAFFGQTKQGLTGLYNTRNEYYLENRKTGEMELIAPQVPFRSEILPAQGSRRQQLAAWVTDAKNPYFSRAIVNRVWALLFSRPLIDPVDDLQATGETSAALQILADDFAKHHFDLQRLIKLIVATEAFQLDSIGTREQAKSFACFPVTPLRPEQVAGSILQMGSLKITGRDPNLLELVATSAARNEFIKRFGDTGEDEFDVRSLTIPQMLQLMNGDLVKEKTKEALSNAATRIAFLTPDNRSAVRMTYLTVLTREPTEEEAAFFEARLGRSTGKQRNQHLEDLFWVLLISSESLCNH